MGTNPLMSLIENEFLVSMKDGTKSSINECLNRRSISKWWVRISWINGGFYVASHVDHPREFPFFILHLLNIMMRGKLKGETCEVAG